MSYSSELPLRSPDHEEPPVIPDHELLRRIGKGSYGMVWLARNATGSLRAVKVVYRDSFDNDRPYQREFEGIRKFEPISHGRESQVDIFHVGINHERGYFYYIMELADDGADGRPGKGQINPETYVPLTLKREVARRGGPLPVEECVRIGVSLTLALEHLHQNGLVHRDVKPSNIILVNGVPKLADIGLVASIDATRSFVGTEGFVSPEGPGTPQSDIFSLGKVLYYMATGGDGDDFPAIPETWRQHPEYPRLLDLNEIIVRACDPAVKKRYQTAAAMRKELLLLERGRSIQHKRTWELARGVAWKAVLGLAALALGVVVVLELMDKHSPPPGTAAVERASVFVLPFRALAQNDPAGQTTNRMVQPGVKPPVIGGAVESQNDLRSRMTDAFIDSLGLIEGLRVGPRKSGWVVQKEEDLRRLMKTNYHVSHVIAGKLATPPGRVKLELSLYETAHDGKVWTETFEGTTNQVIQLERKAIERIAAMLSLDVSDSEWLRIDQKLSNNLAAMYLCQQGLAHREGGTLDSLTKAVGCYHQALALDPLYLDADSGAGYVHRYQAFGSPPGEVWALLRDRARRVLQVDDTHSGGHYALYVLALAYQWDWKEADHLHEQLMRNSVESTGGVFHWAFHHMYMGRTNLSLQAWAELRKRDPELWDRRLVPRSYLSALGWVLRDYDAGVKESEEGVRLFPKHPWLRGQLGQSLLGKRRYDKAIESIQKGRELGEQQWLICLEGYAYGLKGDLEKAQGILNELTALSKGQYLQPALVARVHAGMGNKEKALEWLKKAVDDHAEYLVDAWWGSLITEPAWDDLRDDPRFMELRKRTGMDVWPKPWNGPAWVFGASE